MLEENLSKIGFSPSEIKVYLHLLKQGASYPNKISSETNINRTNIYEALSRLVAKGVVAFIIKHKVKWYEARDPKLVLSLVKIKEDELKKIETSLSKEIKNIDVNSDNSLDANIFTGKKGLRAVFEEILYAKKPISLIAANLEFREVFGSYFELWHKKRIENRIKQRSIFPKSLKSKLKKRDLLEYKFVENVNPTTTIIYGDNALFILWDKEPLVIKIQNKEITKSHQNYFNMLWSQ